MRKHRASRTEQSRRIKPKLGRPSIGIRELKAKASAIIDDVKGRRVSYAVTKRGRVEALIVPSDAGERLLNHRTVTMLGCLADANRSVAQGVRQEKAIGNR